MRLTQASPHHLDKFGILGLGSTWKRFFRKHISSILLLPLATVSLSVKVRDKLHPCLTSEEYTGGQFGSRFSGCSTGSSVEVIGCAYKSWTFFRDFRFIVVPHLDHCLSSAWFHVQLVPALCSIGQQRSSTRPDCASCRRFRGGH